MAEFSIQQSGPHRAPDNWWSDGAGARTAAEELVEHQWLSTPQDCVKPVNGRRSTFDAKSSPADSGIANNRLARADGAPKLATRRVWLDLPRLRPTYAFAGLSTRSSSPAKTLARRFTPAGFACHQTDAKNCQIINSTTIKSMVRRPNASQTHGHKNRS